MYSSWLMFEKYFSFFLMLALFACSNNSTPPNVQTKTSVSPLDSLNDYISDNPNDLPSLILRGRNYLENANLLYADADADAVLEIDSLNHDALLLKGESNYLSNSTRISRDYWTKCIKEHPEDIQCRLKLAELYSIVLDFEKSNELVNRVIEIDPQNPIAFFIKGVNIRDTKGDTALSLSYIQKAIDLDPEYFVAIDMAAVMLANQKNELALSYYNRLIELEPNNFQTYYKMGMYHLGIDNYNAALESFTKSTQINPQDAESFFNMGFIHLDLGLLLEARNFFSKSIEARAINHRAFYGRGFCWERGGDLINAEKDYRQALSLNPQHQASQEALKRIINLK